MVKNTFGGNKHKGQARKFTVQKPNNKLRIAIEDGEIYAIVTKMLGNGMFYAHCSDDILRLGHIRGKFSGRGKRDNIVEIGKWVLIGEREWDIGSNDKSKKIKMINCDLLEVYNDLDKEKLKDSVNINWSILLSQDNSNIVENKDEYIQFTTERKEETNKLMEELASNKLNTIDIRLNNDNNNNNNNESDINNQIDWINVDDI